MTAVIAGGTGSAGVGPGSTVFTAFGNGSYTSFDSARSPMFVGGPVSGLFAHAQGPATGGSLVVTLIDESNSGVLLNCAVLAGNYECSSAGPSAITAGHDYIVAVQNNGTTALVVNWTFEFS